MRLCLRREVNSNIWHDQLASKISALEIDHLRRSSRSSSTHDALPPPCDHIISMIWCTTKPDQIEHSSRKGKRGT